jgi:LemA protein
MTPILLGIVALLVIVVVLVVLTYNTLVTLRNRYRNAFSQIDVQLKRRYDLIPNLVEAVKGFMAHERQTLEAVIQARGAAMNASSAASASPGDPMLLAPLFGAESMLMGAIGRFRMLAEAYPELKADKSAVALMEELASTENRIAFARQAYNDSVLGYNTKRQTFPTNLIAGAMGFVSEVPMFQVDDAQRGAVEVKLG